MLRTLLIATGAFAVLGLTVPAGAEHRAGPPTPGGPSIDGPADSSLDVSLKLGPTGFRFGSRLFGPEGYAGGAWLNGETRRDGVSVDGRIEHGGKAHHFKFSADLDEWVRRAVRAWGVTDL
jgi:hypothetical protein